MSRGSALLIAGSILTSGGCIGFALSVLPASHGASVLLGIIGALLMIFSGLYEPAPDATAEEAAAVSRRMSFLLCVTIVAVVLLGASLFVLWQ